MAIITILVVITRVALPREATHKQGINKAATNNKVTNSKVTNKEVLKVAIHKVVINQAHINKAAISNKVLHKPATYPTTNSAATPQQVTNHSEALDKAKQQDTTIQHPLNLPITSLPCPNTTVNKEETGEEMPNPQAQAKTEREV